jgi:hypothetical protein
MSDARFNTLLNDMRTQTPFPEYDREKVDEAVLALRSLMLHQPGPYRAWKGFDWNALDRLHQKGMIGDPKHTNTLVALTDARGGRRCGGVSTVVRRGW